MIVLDASVLIAHLSSRDPHHTEATQLLREVAGQPLLVHAITLAEVLVGGVRMGKGAEMQADLQAVGVRLTERNDDEPLRLAELRHATKLKLPDCCVLDAAEVHRASLSTYDDALAAAAHQRNVTVVH